MAEAERPELIIVRRRSALDGGEGKNSVWKIAYADFMTAMMAFFLVMWLISATNQETRESVASYFNPIKLADSTPDRKGLSDARRVDPGKAEEGDSARPLPDPGKVEQATKRPQAPQPRFDEAALFRDPYAVLSEIAGAPPRAAQLGASLDPTRKEGMKGGEAYRDPFDPIYWPMASSAPLEKKALGSKEIGSLPFDDDSVVLSEGQGPRPSAGKPDATVTPIQKTDPANTTLAKSDQQDALKPFGLVADEESKSDATANRPPAPRAETAPPPAPSEASKLQAAISAAIASLGAARPVAEVRESNEGLLVSLTDDVNYGMFANGSAEPTQGLVRALDKITPLISQSRGQVIVRGHTDNRAYRTSEYDNWRLSTARAHMAYHMLIRGGLDARRVEHIEGYADRRPKNPNDPSAAQNRRIELLIRAPQP
jgi:chemotaxis protein MotB